MYLGRFELLLYVERQEVLLLIVREALSNVARHAHATQVDMTLERAGERGIMTVQDNGIGMEGGKVNVRTGIGLQGMQERAMALGGELALDSRRDGGTRITVSFPLRARWKMRPLTEHPHRLDEY